MKKFHLSRFCGVACAAAFMFPTAGADGQSVEEFYGKKNLRVIVGSGAGGGYDTYTRTLMRHYYRHVPGTPNVVVQNMPGAGSLRATNHLYHQAEKDGSVIGAIYNTMSLEPLIGTRQARFDVFEFNWLGSLGTQQNICVTWHTSEVDTIDEARETELTASATGATGNSATMPRIFNRLIGTNFKVIQGYSTSGSRLALERGEVDAICGLSYSTLMASVPDWLEQNKLNILAQVGLNPHPDLPGVPMALDMIEDKQDRQVLELLLIRQEPGRPYVAPPGVPEDRLAALRQAFQEVIEDPKFLADAKKTKLQLDPIDHEKIYALLKRAYSYPKAVVERASQIIARPGAVVKCTKYTKEAGWCR